MADVPDDLIVPNDVIVTAATEPAVKNDPSLVADSATGESLAINDALLTVSDAAVQGVTSVPAAVQAVKLPNDKQRNGFYIQAGVYADVTIAERVAVDVVLASPGEEVHVKPLKNSHMYRITVGPIVSAEHASKVSTQLDTEGVENFIVSVK